MPFQIVRNDITKMKVDAIVNTAAAEPGFGRGTDSAVYKKAGIGKLFARRKKIGRIETGEAEITSAFSLDAKYIIHTAGPLWQGGQQKEEELLRRCYTNSLRLARKHGCESIAFPLISTGSYGFPKALGLETAMAAIRDFLSENEMTVYLVVFDRESFGLSEELFPGVNSYIDEHYVQEKLAEEYGETVGSEPGEMSLYEMPEEQPASERLPGTARKRSGSELPGDAAGREAASEGMSDMAGRKPTSGQIPNTASREPVSGQMADMASPAPTSERIYNAVGQASVPRQQMPKDMSSFAERASEKPKDRPFFAGRASEKPKSAPFVKGTAVKLSSALPEGSARPAASRSLEDVMAQLGETFQQRLLRLIDERGMTDVEVYKRANLDRKLFSKIRCNVNYRPKKMTALALAVALRLNLDETKDLLSRAELALSPSSKVDLIIQYFIEQNVYDIYSINLALFEHEQPLLGEAVQN